VHDAANILRRYFNQLPEPIIPLEFYERFRDPLKNHQAQAVGAMDAQSPTIGDFQPDAAIRIYQALITELPPLNRQLLLYILDLLAVFASKSDLNKMTTPNLAAIFQPGLLSHPQHDMAPQEYRLSQDVLIFLIENQDSFLIGMPGTAADHETVKEVQSGVPSPTKVPGSPVTPSRSKTVVNRSSSNASNNNAEGRWNSLRRNVSVSSKHSKRSEAGPTPVTPIIGTPTTPGGSVHRSNTVPSRRPGGPAGSARNFPRDKTSSPSTSNRPSPVASAAGSQRHEPPMPNAVAAAVPALPLAPPSITSASSSENTTPLATIRSESSSALARDFQTPKKDTTPLLAPSIAPSETPTERQAGSTPTGATAHGFLNIFKQSPSSDGEGRKPNKLQKKRIPGSALSSAQSSTHDLAEDVDEQRPAALPGLPMNMGSNAEQVAPPGGQSQYTTAQTPPVKAVPHRTPTDATLKPTISPSHSFNSHTDVTDQSDADMVGDDMPTPGADSEQRERRRHRWRFSRTQNRIDPPTSPPPPGGPLGMMSPKEQAMSRSTIGSSSASASQPRRSFQEPVPLGSSATDPNITPTQTSGQHGGASDSGVFSDSERERKGPMGWIRGKIQERKERDAERRTRTPERSQSSANGRQDFGTPVHMDALTERPRDASGSSAGKESAVPPSSVPSGAATAPMPGASNAGNPVPMAPQEQIPRERVQTASDPASAPLVDSHPPTAPQDPAIHDRVDAVMGGKSD